MLPPTTLADGAIVRTATEADVAEMLAIEADREGEDDAVDLELVTKTPGGLESISVVERDGAVLSMATLLDETVRVGSAELPAGQVEMVATAKDAEGRGYVRALMERCHALSKERGHVMQVMIGIPNFYRQFGYAYSIRMHPWATVTPGLTPPDGTTIDVAKAADISTCHALQQVAQAVYDIAMPHSEDCWSWLIDQVSSDQWIARNAAGDPIGVARVADYGDGEVAVGELAATEAAGTHAILAAALAAAGPDGSVRVNVRPHTPELAIATQETERLDWYYVRIEDPTALLTALAPELLHRLTKADRPQGEAMLSFFRRHVRLSWADGELQVTSGGPVQAPVSQGGSGIPTDALGTLIFGDGAECLEDRFPDASLGKQEDLMKVLFPPQQADLLTFYLTS